MGTIKSNLQFFALPRCYLRYLSAGSFQLTSFSRTSSVTWLLSLWKWRINWHLPEQLGEEGVVKILCWSKANSAFSLGSFLFLTVANNCSWQKSETNPSGSCISCISCVPIAYAILIVNRAFVAFLLRRTSKIRNYCIMSILICHTALEYIYLSAKMS